MAKKVYIQMRQDMTSPEGSGFPVAVYASKDAAWDAAEADNFGRGYVEEVEAFGFDMADAERG